jgi:predicted MFS family arabinose efflux permease
LRTYLVVFFEGLLILGSFSYLGAFASKSLGLGTFAIGLLMAVFGVGVLVASRASGRLADRIGRNRLVALGLAAAAAADLLIVAGGSHLGAAAAAVLLLGLGFMFAHSSLLTTATQFAAKARGTAMSLVAFAFMVGGAVGTTLGGRIIEATTYREFYLVGGVALAALTLVARVAVPTQRHLEEMPGRAGSPQVGAERLGGEEVG